MRALFPLPPFSRSLFKLSPGSDNFFIHCLPVGLAVLNIYFPALKSAVPASICLIAFEFELVCEEDFIEVLTRQAAVYQSALARVIYFLAPYCRIQVESARKV